MHFKGRKTGKEGGRQRRIGKQPWLCWYNMEGYTKVLANSHLTNGHTGLLGLRTGNSIWMLFTF